MTNENNMSIEEIMNTMWKQGKLLRSITADLNGDYLYIHSDADPKNIRAVEDKQGKKFISVEQYLKSLN
jgi:hypothetical protein